MTRKLADDVLSLQRQDHSCAIALVAAVCLPECCQFGSFVFAGDGYARTKFMGRMELAGADNDTIDGGMYSHGGLVNSTGASFQRVSEA